MSLPAARKQNLRPTGSIPLHCLRRQYQLLAYARLHRRVSSVRNDYVFCLWPGARQFVGTADRAHHIVAALHDNPRQMPNGVDPRDQIAIPVKQIAAEEMRFDPRKPESEAIFAKSRHGL